MCNYVKLLAYAVIFLHYHMLEVAAVLLLNRNDSFFCGACIIQKKVNVES